MVVASLHKESSSIAQEFSARLLDNVPNHLKQNALIISEFIDTVHSFMLKHRISPDQFRQIVRFFEHVGEFSDAKRHEFMLLADVFGLSALVAKISADDSASGAGQALFAPFYRPDAPLLANGASISLDKRGEPLVVSGRVLSSHGMPIADALVEVWHANADGLYENQEPDNQPEFNLRGRFRSDAEGRFHFRSVKPKGYALPEDGPVGQLLNGLGYPLKRPAHINFKVSADGFSTVTTEFFDRTDAANTADAMFHLKPELLTDLVQTGDKPRQWSMSIEIPMVAKAATRKTSRNGESRVERTSR